MVNRQDYIGQDKDTKESKVNFWFDLSKRGFISTSRKIIIKKIMSVY